MTTILENNEITPNNLQNPIEVSKVDKNQKMIAVGLGVLVIITVLIMVLVTSNRPVEESNNNNTEIVSEEDNNETEREIDYAELNSEGAVDGALDEVDQAINDLDIETALEDIDTELEFGL